MKKWRQLAEEKSAIDQQTEEIHQKFRMDKINKEFGQLSGEEFLDQLQKGLMKRAAPLRKKKKRRSSEEEVMNSDRTHSHQHHHQHHPHIKKLLMMMMMIFHHHHPKR